MDIFIIISSGRDSEKPRIKAKVSKRNHITNTEKCSEPARKISVASYWYLGRKTGGSYARRSVACSDQQSCRRQRV